VAISDDGSALAAGTGADDQHLMLFEAEEISEETAPEPTPEAVIETIEDTGSGVTAETGASASLQADMTEMDLLQTNVPETDEEQKPLLIASGGALLIGGVALIISRKKK